MDGKDADVIGDEPIYFKGEIAGWVTSGGYAHASGVSMAMGYVRTEFAEQEEDGRSSFWLICFLHECKNSLYSIVMPAACAANRRLDEGRGG